MYVIVLVPVLPYKNLAVICQGKVTSEWVAYHFHQYCIVMPLCHLDNGVDSERFLRKLLITIKLKIIKRSPYFLVFLFLLFLVSFLKINKDNCVLRKHFIILNKKISPNIFLTFNFIIHKIEGIYRKNKWICRHNRNCLSVKVLQQTISFLNKKYILL